MKMDALSHNSYWRTPGDSIEAPAQPLPQRVEVAIIGAGITGLTAGLHLRRAGVSVAILEAGTVGAGTTGGTSAHLDAHPEQGASRLIRQYGLEAARTTTTARMAAIQQIEDWVNEYQIDCEFQRIPGFWYSEEERRAHDVQKEAAALMDLALSVETVTEVGLPFATASGVRIENQARFHPLKYLKGLAEQLIIAGGVLCEHVRAQPPEDGTPCKIETSRGTLEAERVLVCAHSAYLGMSQLDTRVAPYQSYVIAARIAEAIPDALFWDNADPYHYWRRAEGNDPHLVIVGGEDHKTGQENEHDALERLEAYLRQRVTVESVECRWSAELFEPVDDLPYIGRVPSTKQLFIATGFSGTGLTFGTLAGHLLSDLVLDRKNPVADLFSPSRVKPLAAAFDFVKENVNVAQHFVMDRFKGDRVKAFEEIALGEGRLVIHNGKQIAAYRDQKGELFLLSPVCTHMGCHVLWNEVEQTWDCPCHGGRYSATGERLYGPPTEDLVPLFEKIEAH